MKNYIRIFRDWEPEEDWEGPDKGDLYASGLFNAEVNGIKIGPWKMYHDNGNIMFKGSYKDGKEDGFWTWYYENDNIMFEGSYKDGKEEGPFKWYYKNGDLMV